MKKTALTVILALWALVPALTSPGTPDSPPGKKPVMEFEETTWDFGTLEPGAEAKHIFTFTNRGKTPIVITAVRSSCGCTTPVWTREPVRKNKKGTITVRYNTHIIGRFRKTVTVMSNAENSPVTLVIRGEVKNKSKVNQEQKK